MPRTGSVTFVPFQMSSESPEHREQHCGDLLTGCKVVALRGHAELHIVAEAALSQHPVHQVSVAMEPGEDSPYVLPGLYPGAGRGTGAVHRGAY